MDANRQKQISKLLSLILRHHPESIDLSLDEEGWANVDELLSKLPLKFVFMSFEELAFLVENNDKKRFSFSADTSKIRANQGHSLDVNLQLAPQKPPAVLFHGTVQRFIEAISTEGLSKMSRQYVHLSKDEETAIKVAQRRGKPIVLKVNAEQMYQDGYYFYCSDNGVWLTESVPANYIEIPLF